MPILTKEQKSERVTHHNLQLLKRFVLMQIPVAVIGSGALLAMLFPEIVPQDKTIPLGIVGVSFTAFMVQLAEGVYYAVKATNEYGTWKKPASPAEEPITITRGEYEKLMAKASGAVAQMGRK